MKQCEERIRMSKEVLRAFTDWMTDNIKDGKLKETQYSKELFTALKGVGFQDININSLIHSMFVAFIGGMDYAEKNP